MVVINGLGIESWLDSMIHAGGEAKTVVKISAGLKWQLIYSKPYLKSESGDKDGGQRSAFPNPHIWLDPRLVEHGVTNLLLSMQKADPANAEGYERNAREYLKRLEKLDAELAAGLALYKGRAIVTFHDAYPYFARRYGLRIVGVIEEVPDVEPSPRYLARLREVMQREGVKVIFSDKQFPAKLADQIGLDYHVRVAQLDTLETGEMKPGAYEEAMRANLHALVEALK